MEPPASRRKRARPTGPSGRSELREDVAALIRSSKVPLEAQRRGIEEAYDTAWRTFCQCPRSEDATQDAARGRLAATLRELSKALIQGGAFARETAVRRLARSVVVSRGNVRLQQLALEWSWLGHTNREPSRLWRLNDVVETIALATVGASDPKAPSFVSEWLRVAVCSLMERQELGSGVRCGDVTSRQIVAYLVQVAFVESSGPGSEDGVESAPFRPAALARDALAALSSGVQGNLRPFKLVCEVIASSIRRYQSDEGVVSPLRRFLRSLAKQYLSEVASTTRPEHCDPTNEHTAITSEIFAFIQSSVYPAEVVQLFRQVWVEASARQEADPVESLRELIADCAERDPGFRAHALATAHDLAHDAISESNAAMLRHSLELVAAATVGPIDEDGNRVDAGYVSWFKAHFSVADSSWQSAMSSSSENSRLSICSNGSERVLSQPCLRAPVPAPSSDGSITSTPPTVCGLVSTKRHLQFVCAFLLEFDRSQSFQHRAHHVLAHLSALKTHQATSGHAVAGLLTDFTTQTRALYAKLQASEQESIARERRRRLSHLSATNSASGSSATLTQLTPVLSQYSASTRSLVEELLQLYVKDVSSMMSKVNQLKMFNGPLWKHEVLPCCVDIEYWQSFATSNHDAADSDFVVGRTLEMVGFVQTLAKHHVVGNDQYVEFLERVEKLILSIQPQERVLEPKNRTIYSSSDRSLALLEDAVNTHLRLMSTEGANCTSTARHHLGPVVDAFVAAFEDLIHLRGEAQQNQIRSVYALIVRRYSKEVAAGTISLDLVVEFHLAMWTALLSSVSRDDASPQQRVQSMEAYCRLVGDIPNSAVGSQDDFVLMTLYGILLGLLASIPASESLARSCSLQICTQLALSSSDGTVEHLVKPLKFACSFLTGLLVAFAKSCSTSSPQMVFGSLLTPQLRECLIWVSHHSRYWWSSTISDNSETSNKSTWWSFIGRAIQDVHEDYGWFRLTFSPGVLTSKDHWHIFLAMEFTCCATDMFADPSHVEVVDFINRQREQLDILLFTSSSGQSAEVRVTDVCIWIVQAILELAASSSCGNTALDVFVLLLRETWVARDPSQTDSPSDALGFSIEMTVQLCEKLPELPTRVVHYAVRCVKAILDGLNVATSPVEVHPAIVRHFVNIVGSAFPPRELCFEWTSMLWCLIGKLKNASDVHSTVSDIPVGVFARWAYDFPRLCHLLPLRKNGRTIQAISLSLLQPVQRCFEFYRTLSVRGLGQPPALSLVGASASQYMPTSADDGSLGLHVRSLEWLIASGLLPTPHLVPEPVGLPILGLETTLAFHDSAGRVLSALLEDVSIGRPEDVATELTEVFQDCWLKTVSVTEPSSFKYQLLLVHMVAELATRHASVGRFLLRSSSELLNNPQRSLFLSLVLATSSEIEQLDSILRLNGSLWVNTFAEVACCLVDSGERRNDAQNGLPTQLLRHAASFEKLINLILSRVLGFAAARQVDLLDADVISRIEKLFPSLREVLSRVPVLNLASAALADW